MEKKQNLNFVSMTQLEHIAEAFKSQVSESSSSTHDEKRSAPELLFPTDKESHLEFIRAQMQRLEKPIAEFLYPEDESKFFHPEDLEE